jgi:hypothetical protein
VSHQTPRSAKRRLGCAESGTLAHLKLKRIDSTGLAAFTISGWEADPAPG